MPTIEEVLRQGWQIHQSGRYAEAERVYRHVLSQFPRDANSLVYLGIALFDQRRFDESVAAYRAALAIQSNFPVAWNNLGNSLRMLGKVDEAEQCFDQALKQRPGYLSALKNRGTLWVWSGEVERGLKWYEQGLLAEPDHAELHRNLGVIHLLLGDYERGWPEYRWRWKMPGLVRPQCGAPVWQGEELAGKRILLYPEQGRGDSIQFARMAAILNRIGAQTIVECDTQMLPLLSCVRGIGAIFPEGMQLPQVDYQASFIEAVDAWYTQRRELPWHQEELPTTAGYIDLPDGLKHYWKNWLDANVPGFRIGINWQGNPQHHADVYRSLPLQALQPLIDIDGVSWVSLQFGTGTEQLASCSFRDRIHGLPTPLDTSSGAFMDTASLVESLDMVITSDTAIAHLAGALGKPVHILLGKVPDWRWLTSGDTTPWYPSATLIRQAKLGAWDDVVAEVLRRLRAQISPTSGAL